MKKSPWFSCKQQAPVRNGVYEVRLKEEDFPGGYQRAYKYFYLDGAWYYMGRLQTGIDRPGYYVADQWRGVLK